MHKVLREEVINEHPAGDEGAGEEDEARYCLQHHHPFQANQ